ncbi:hypothetical protein TNCV_1533301 [Trichonephila clavipes]|nr:hypothetical protein TNCV_1533301 [Trichonephila clavipes]
MATLFQPTQEVKREGANQQPILFAKGLRKGKGGVVPNAAKQKGKQIQRSIEWIAPSSSRHGYNHPGVPKECSDVTKLIANPMRDDKRDLFRVRVD